MYVHQIDPLQFKPKALEPYDIDIKVQACGVCGSDLHAITNGWGMDMPMPLCVGHEIVGEVVAVGDKVTTVKKGDRAGIGAQIWSCGKCEQCKVSSFIRDRKPQC